MARLVLYFSASAHSLYRRERTGLQLLQQFTPGDAGLRQLHDCLKARRGTLVQVVVEPASEDFHEDQIPYVRGAERRAVIDRRLAQRYPDAPFATALSLGPAADERRSERL